MKVRYGWVRLSRNLEIAVLSTNFEIAQNCRYDNKIWNVFFVAKKIFGELLWLVEVFLRKLE
jgi:hypothetical protein